MTDPYYEADGVTLYHGDCLEILPEISGVALTVTSPPYNVLEGFNKNNDAGGAGRRGVVRNHAAWAAKVRATHYQDRLPESEYQDGQRRTMYAISKASERGASLFYNHKCRWVDRTLIHPVDLARTWTEWTLRQEIIWARPGGPMPGSGKFRVSDERILWLTNGPRQRYWDNRCEGDGTVWKINPAGATGNGGNHPAPFPAEIPWRAVLATTERGDLVLDPYAGSGTTLRVARELGRRAVGIEKREDFCEMIVMGLGG